MALRRRILNPISLNGSQPDDYTYCIFNPCPPPPEPSSDSIPIDVSHPNHHLTNLLIAGCSLLGTTLLIFAALFFTIRRRRRRHGITTPSPPSDGPPSPLADPIDHHVWQIRTVGLDAATIASISIVRFKPGEGLIDGSDCAVCLTEFRDGEDLRLLPKCSHAFHLPCIDTWLRSRVSCPLCRAPIVASKDVPAPASESIGLEVSLGNSSESVDGERTVAIVEGDGERMIEIAIGSCSQGSSSETRVPEDWQPVRRSVSMDASSLGALLLRGEPEEKKDDSFGEETNNKKRAKQGSDMKMEIVKKGMVRMGRSLSSSGRWFHLSRGKVTPTTVLPL